MRIVLLFAVQVFCSAFAARYVYEGFDTGPDDLYGDGYGLIGFWNTRNFSDGSTSDYGLVDGSLTGIGSTDSSHLERVQGASTATIWRDLLDPIGPGTTKYLGFLIGYPNNGQLLPTAVSFGVLLADQFDGVYVGIGNSAGGKFRVKTMNGGTSQTSSTPMAAGQTYFCVLKLECGTSTITCSLYVGGDETKPANATIQIPSRTLTSLGITSNYHFSVDEIRIADSIAELRQTAPSPPYVSCSAPAFSAAEGNSGTNYIPVTLTLSKASTFPAYVRFSMFGSTASTDDFVAINPLSIRFAPGETEKMVLVGIRGDTTVEPDEKMSGFFGSFAGVSHGSFMHPEFTIVNDDFAPADVTMSFERNGDWLVNWIQSSSHLVLQSSLDLTEWQNYDPPTFSDQPGPVKVDVSSDRQFFRFTTP